MNGPFKTNKPIVLCGMGGSHLGARLLSLSPSCPPFYIHSDYGMPPLPEAWRSSAVYIASSYSGETEEVLDAARAVLAKNLPLAVIAAGGALLALAKEKGLPYVVLPKEPLEPRIAMGYQMRALAALMENETLLSETEEAAKGVALEKAKARGKELAKKISGNVPFFYASSKNLPIAYHIKVSLNETGKIPTAYGIIPEICHNEISGYDSPQGSVLPVLLEDVEDTPRNAERMKLLGTVLEEKGDAVVRFPLSSSSALENALEMVIAANYAGALLAKERGLPDAATPLIASFKKRLS